MLRGEDENWVTEKEALKNLAVNFYSELFKSNTEARGIHNWRIP